TTIAAEPDATVVADEHVRGLRGVEGQGVEVRVLIPAKVLPGLAAIIRAEDATGADAVVELPARKDHVRIAGVGLDDVVVEALAAAVVLDAIRARTCGKDRPARCQVSGLEHP